MSILELIDLILLIIRFLERDVIVLVVINGWLHSDPRVTLALRARIPTLECYSVEKIVYLH